MKVKRALGKFWFLLWKDESFKGWIFSIVFLFVFIKLIFFPLLNVLTGTSLPLAIVESCSMYHKGNIFSDYDTWWPEHYLKYSALDVNKSEFERFIFKNGFNKGDILFIIGTNSGKIKIGDVIIFEAGQKNPIIHRVIKIEERGGRRIFSTIGDNNNGQISFEKEISEKDILGKAVFKIAPYIGWGKLIFFEPSKPESERGFCVQN